MAVQSVDIKNIVHRLVGHGLKPSIFRIESTGKYRFAAKGMSKQKTLERRGAEVTEYGTDNAANNIVETLLNKGNLNTCQKSCK